MNGRAIHCFITLAAEFKRHDDLELDPRPMELFRQRRDEDATQVSTPARERRRENTDSDQYDTFSGERLIRGSLLKVQVDK